MPRKLTTEEIIERAKKVHGDKYDYSKLVYKNMRTKVTIICPKHGEFQQFLTGHIGNGNGCMKCNLEHIGFTTEEFIERAKKVHGDKYDYSKVKYVNNKIHVTIICPKHGEFIQSPVSHINIGSDCPECGIDKTRLTTEEFLRRAKEIHGDKYDYSKIIFKGSIEDVTIICPKHGEFIQKPSNHINIEQGCPYCSESKGEKFVGRWLNTNNILFEKQKTFDDCVHKKKLRFDFYVPHLNMCIEYDGAQHFRPVDVWGGQKGLIETQKRDAIKTKYCEDNNINLLRIKYNDNAEDILSKHINAS